MSSFEVIPAIDLRGGKCVRLTQGRVETAREYSADPVATACRWFEEGARRLHVVNLDGAFGRASDHLAILSRIRDGVDAVIQYGGGLRTPADMETALAAGADKVVLGTVAVEQPQKLEEALRWLGEDRVIVALDAVGGKVASRGWQAVTDLGVDRAAQDLKRAGVRETLVTDVGRDGMLSGINLDLIKLVAASGVCVLASGGLSSTADLKSLLELRLTSVVGVIVGKALYEGHVTLPDLIAFVKEKDVHGA